MMINWACDEHVRNNDFGVSFEHAYKIAKDCPNCEVE